MKNILLSALVLLTTGILPLQADYEKIRVAVIDFETQGFNAADEMGKIVSEWLTTALVQEGRFDVIERVLLKKVFEEQNFTQTGKVDESSVLQLGQILGAINIITGTISTYGNVFEVNARIIDVEDASIVFADSVKGTSEAMLKEKVFEMAGEIIRAFPLEGYIVDRRDGQAAIDLGLGAGVTPGMIFTVYKEGEVIKHPKTGEVLEIEQIPTGQLEIDFVRESTSNCRIISEDKENPIEYGNMVKSLDRARMERQAERVAEQKKIETKEQVAVVQKPSRPAPVAAPPTPVRSQPVTEVPEHIQKLRSDDYGENVRGMKLIRKQKMHDRETIEEVRKFLDKGIEAGIMNRHYIGALEHAVIILGEEGGNRELLQDAARYGYHKSIKARAERYVR